MVMMKLVDECCDKMNKYLYTQRFFSHRKLLKNIKLVGLKKKVNNVKLDGKLKLLTRKSLLLLGLICKFTPEIY